MKQNTPRDDYIEILEKENPTTRDFIYFFLINEENKSYINECNSKGYTALHKAATLDNVTLIDSLLNTGAVVNAGAHDGTTPLHLAVLNNKLDIAKGLIKEGANIFSETNSGEIPLYYAISNQNLPIVKMLLEYECIDIDRYNYYLSNALERAKLEGAGEIAEFLKIRLEDKNLRPLKKVKTDHMQPNITIEQGDWLGECVMSRVNDFEDWNEVIVQQFRLPQDDCEVIIINGSDTEEALTYTGSNKRKRGEEQTFTEKLEKERNLPQDEKRGRGT
ncbi:ankyrin repeat domain protein [endosymbiont of Acanthamoeba sp. UWC8]|uniref:ankyrin repeat domain-containing protein n=1 Tax=endosymbiont of Acanthamoeba sp. UWC8 TaxID=86106 RepID=UPI0004D11C7D|nr:ankyrin repeat domain-containing protein [endosymbiont of Acanthamoeba sp. UWC8]AIF81501.1 ankyrin repeat domain protein [endosymbiont of Acanthamoeba sp. UWC8]